MGVRVPTFLVGFALVLVTAPAFGGAGVWTTNGPPAANSVISDSQMPGAIYAGSPNGIFKSMDDGVTWLPAGFTFHSANPLGTAPPGTVYAASGTPPNIHQSLDGGATWSLMGPDVCAGSCAFVVDPFSSNTVFRSVNPPSNGSGSEILRSTDGGMSWTEADAGLGLDHAVVTALIADPNAAGTLYAATEPIQFVAPTTPTLFKTTDSGATWFSLAKGLGFPLTLAVDPTTSSTLYVGRPPNLNPYAPDGGIFKSVDGGRTFLPSSNGLTNPSVLSICIDPVHPNRVYLSTGSFGVFGSADGGSSWNALNTGLPTGGFRTLVIASTGTHLHAANGSGVFDYEVSDNCSTATTLCLNDSRFTVSADFQQTAEGAFSPATAVRLTSDTGYFWFFDPSNVEVVTKVLDGCSSNGHFWFFASGLTNVGVQITVIDTVTGASKPYSNALGTVFPPIQDTAAFPCP
jgi:photosystem II stability/assembly factor-like uncharacterized protein